MATTGFGAPWTVDGTALHLNRGRQPVSASHVCPPPAPTAPSLGNQPLTTLGVAAVAYSKKQGTMTWGHASLRAVYCLGEELVDAEYEVYRLSSWNEAQLRNEHAGEAFARATWLTTQRGAKVLFRNRNPVDAGWYADAQAANREIYEMWLDLEPAALDAVVLRAEASYDAQATTLRAHENLEVRYHVLSDNCTAVFRDFLPDGLVRGEPITPFAWLRQLEPHAKARVLHPSHHLVKRWGGVLPEVVRRPRPVFRRRPSLRADELPNLREALLDAVPELPF